MSIKIDAVQFKQRLGKEIAALRVAAGFKTQIALGQAAGLRSAAISGWELGKTMPDLMSLVRIAPAIKTTVAHLLAVGNGAVKQTALPPTRSAIHPRARAVADTLARELSAEIARRPWREDLLITHWQGEIKATCFEERVPAAAPPAAQPPPGSVSGRGQRPGRPDKKQRQAAPSKTP